MQTRLAYLFLATSLLAGCRTGRNYPGADGPRYSRRPEVERVSVRAAVDTIRVVSFNIAFCRRADSAITLLK